MGFENQAKKPRVVETHKWGDTDTLPDFNNIDMGHLEKTYAVSPEAANDPSGAIVDVVSSVTSREAIIENPELIDRLASGFELAPDVNLRPTLSPGYKPGILTGGQINTIGEIYNDTRDRNLDRVSPPPLRAGGEIPGNINDAEVVEDKTKSWQKPAPVRPAKPSLFKRWFGKK